MPWPRMQLRLWLGNSEYTVIEIRRPAILVSHTFLLGITLQIICFLALQSLVCYNPRFEVIEGQMHSTYPFERSLPSLG